ncbi:hypothetical protein C1H71_15380 [Iodobacter fluviatilis]|uniref:Putative DNA-binding domain-containing protein n=2 Tax=Iodobacter fluviatilis TaxID=537 RepID=A0A7G3GBJ7_9NEIS|nr:hypothetical protein C1H71_15380 [Iodobacter fluviatilis]
MPQKEHEMSAYVNMELSQEFSSILRNKQSITKDPSILLYREFLRGNIENVIEHTFPVFYQKTGIKNVQQHIDDFLQDHHALSPEFHHIATEFLTFIQERVSPEIRQGLEYEWVLFCVEIDEGIVSHCSPEGLSNESILTTNPTLLCITLNQEIDGLQGSFAIFRDAQHQVIRKPLSLFDHWMLSQIGTSCSFLALKSSTETTEMQLQHWLSEATEIGLIQHQSTLRLEC